MEDFGKLDKMRKVNRKGSKLQKCLKISDLDR